MSVYIIVNLETDKAYIGQTRNSLEKRFAQHCEPNKASKSIISQSISKYGRDAFYMETLWESPGCSQEELNAKEMELIVEHNTQAPAGYNITAGGQGMATPSEETRKKMSESAQQKFIDRPELLENLARVAHNRVCIDETKAKRSATMKEKFANDQEFKAKIVGALIGRKASVEARENYRRGKIKYDTEHPDLFRNIYVFNTDRKLIQTFGKLMDAERGGFNRNSIVRCIKSGKLFKRSFYFSYSSSLPSVATVEAVEKCRHGF